MRRVLVVLLAFATLGVTSAYSAETSVKGTVFADWMLNMTDGADNYNAFTVDRAYFGAESKLSDYTSMRITFDIRPERFSTSSTKVVDSDGDTVNIPSMSAYAGYPIVLKYAYADFKIKPIAKVLKARLGLQPTMYLNYLEGFWGMRYIERNTSDLNGWVSTADLGISALASLGPNGNAGEIGVSILNGTKYSDFVDKNKNKDFNFFGKLTPFYNNGDFNQSALISQFYSGVQNRTIASTESGSDWKRQIVSVGGKLDYRKKASFTADLNFQTLGQGTAADLKQSGLSFFGNVYLSGLAPSSAMFKTLNLFGRFDQYDPNTDVSDDGYSLLLAGVECSPVKGVKASIFYRQKSPEAVNVVDDKSLALNTEFKF